MCLLQVNNLHPKAVTEAILHNFIFPNAFQHFLLKNLSNELNICCSLKQFVGLSVEEVAITWQAKSNQKRSLFFCFCFFLCLDDTFSHISLLFIFNLPDPQVETSIISFHFEYFGFNVYLKSPHARFIM